MCTSGRSVLTGQLIDPRSDRSHGEDFSMRQGRVVCCSSLGGSRDGGGGR